MQDQLISFETARLAREKGFNIPCKAKINCSHYHFVENNIIPKNIGTSENEMFAPVKNWNNLEEPDHYRQQIILKGLNTSLPTQSLLQRWLREIHSINFFVYLKGDEGWIYSFSYHISDFSKEIYKSYEEALEQGLLKALKLIK